MLWETKKNPQNEIMIECASVRIITLRCSQSMMNTLSGYSLHKLAFRSIICFSSGKFCFLQGLGFIPCGDITRFHPSSNIRRCSSTSRIHSDCSMYPSCRDFAPRTAAILIATDFFHRPQVSIFFSFFAARNSRRSMSFARLSNAFSMLSPKTSRQ